MHPIVQNALKLIPVPVLKRIRNAMHWPYVKPWAEPPPPVLSVKGTS